MEMTTLMGGTAAVSMLLLAAGAAIGDAGAAGDMIRLKYATFDPVAGAPAVPAGLAAGAKSGLFIVQFHATPTEAMRERLQRAGATALRFISDHAYVVRAEPGRAGALAALEGVRWAGAYHPAYKLSAEAMVDALAGGAAARYCVELMERGPAAQQRVADRIVAMGGIIERTSPGGFLLEATLDSAALAAVAAMDDVNFIDPWGPPGSDMVLARAVTGAAFLSGLGFSGQGVRGEVMDDGILLSHAAFQSPPPLLHGPSGAGDHGTQVYSVLFASGNAAATGMLPAREQGIFATYQTFSDPVIHLGELVNPALPYRAVFQSNSWGNPQTTAYTTISAQIDDAMFRADLALFQSVGNTGTNLLRPQAWAKNTVAVGGFNASGTETRADDSSASVSAFGPAADGRVKPDVVNLFEGIQTAVSPGPDTYGPLTGTSGSAPVTAGVVGLIHQLWHEGAWAGHGGGATVFDSRPHAATARALLFNSAHQYDWTAGGPNATLTRARQGWGGPDLAALYAARQSTFVVDESDILTPAAPTVVYGLTVAPGRPALKATMVYSDPMGNPAAARARINDLTLKVTAPGGAVYWGNAGLSAGIWSTPGGSPDIVNVVEHVFIQNPEPGIWRFEVRADELVQDARPETPGLDADFALVVSGITPPCYANCDSSTAPPILNVNDFVCFQSLFAAGSPAANCDRSTTPPILNVNDFVCFQSAFAAGCP